jgi:hypothetical protein
MPCRDVRRPQVFLCSRTPELCSFGDQSATTDPIPNASTAAAAGESPKQTNSAGEAAAPGATRGVAETLPTQPAVLLTQPVVVGQRNGEELSRSADRNSAALATPRLSATSDGQTQATPFPSIQEIISAMSRPVDSPLRTKRQSAQRHDEAAETRTVEPADRGATDERQPPHTCHDVKKLRLLADEPPCTPASPVPRAATLSAVCTVSAARGSGSMPAAAVPLDAPDDVDQEDADLRVAIALSLAPHGSVACDHCDQHADSTTSADGEGACGLTATAPPPPPPLSVKGARAGASFGWRGTAQPHDAHAVMPPEQSAADSALALGLSARPSGCPWRQRASLRTAPITRERRALQTCMSTSTRRTASESSSGSSRWFAYRQGNRTVTMRLRTDCPLRLSAPPQPGACSAQASLRASARATRFARLTSARVTLWRRGAARRGAAHARSGRCAGRHGRDVAQVRGQRREVTARWAAQLEEVSERTAYVQLTARCNAQRQPAQRARSHPHR